MKEALKEALTNILIANCLNFPINYLILSTALPLQWSALTITVITTLIFTVVALIRFMSIRTWFSRRQSNDRKDSPKVHVRVHNGAGVHRSRHSFTAHHNLSPRK